MICSKHTLALALLVSVATAQDTEVCEGEALVTVSNGCISADVCGEMATEMGLELGNELYPFAADYVDKGCFYFAPNHPLYPNQAYFGIQGTCAELRIASSEGGTRLSCDGNTQAPFDATRCEGDICVTMEECEDQALAMGMTLGSENFPFEGPWLVKGCTFYAADHEEFPNQAYWGEGASICGQLRANPNDGSLRMTCEAEGVTTVPAEGTGEPEEETTTAPEVETTTTTEPEEETEATTVPETTEELDEVTEVETTTEPEETTTEAPDAVTDTNTTEAPAPPAASPVDTTPGPTAAETTAMPDPTPAGNVTVPTDEEEEEPAQAPSLSPIDQIVADKNSKNQQNDKDDKNNVGVDDEDDEDDEDFDDTDLSVSRIEGAQNLQSDASSMSEYVAVFSVVLAFFM